MCVRFSIYFKMFWKHFFVSYHLFSSKLSRVSFSPWGGWQFSKKKNSRLLFYVKTKRKCKNLPFFWYHLLVKMYKIQLPNFLGLMSLDVGMLLIWIKKQLFSKNIYTYISAILISRFCNMKKKILPSYLFGLFFYSAIVFRWPRTIGSKCQKSKNEFE